MTVKVIKLVTGEEVLADILNDNEKILEIQKAIRFMPTNQGLMPLDFPLMSKQGNILLIEKNAVIFTCEPSDKALEAYDSYFSEIIKPNTSNLIV